MPEPCTGGFRPTRVFQYLVGVRPPLRTMLSVCLSLATALWGCNSDTVLVIETTPVSAVADAVSAHGGNWEGSQLAERAGVFAGVVENV